ncbi:MAG: SDR family oxidoreductase [Actinobacteria bacterium]|nr:SDR family oxidoreductase [Actinomycetota bacterium]
MGVMAVTGSAGGLGRAICERIEQAGHRVIGVDVRDAEVVADLSTPSGRDEAVRAVGAACDGVLDGLVACAGLGGTVKPASLVARVNYFGAVGVLDGLKPCLGRGANPAAVAISSNSATAVPPGDDGLVERFLDGDEQGAAALADENDGELVYARSKLALARAVRRRVPEWGRDGIRLNAVAPGPVLTPLTQAALQHPVSGPLIKAFPVPLDRWGEPAEIAEAVWFLLGPQGSWIHGVVLFVDGGTDALIRGDAY